MGGQQENKIHKYITFPLNLTQGLLLSDLVETKSILKKIITWGVSDFAINKSTYETRTLAKQAVYLYYAGYLPLPFKFEAEQAINNGKLLLYSDTKGFASDGDEFNPEDEEVQSMIDFITKSQYNGIWDWCKLSFRVPHNQIREHYNVYLEISQDQKDFIDKHGKDAPVSVSIDMMFDFLKEPPDTSLLTAYFALRSLQGKNKTFIQTFKKTILLRMTGCKSHKALDEIYSIELSDRMEKLQRKRTFLSLLSKLEDRGLLKGRFVIPNKKVNFYLLSTSINAIEIAKLYAKKEAESDRKRTQRKAQEVYNQLIADIK